MKDKDLRKAFKALVSHLGGSVDESLYDVGGVYGVYLASDIKKMRKHAEDMNMLLKYLELEVFRGEEMRKIKK